MCLITTNPQILTAKEDMTVYKLLKVEEDYRSPFRHYPYGEGGAFTTDMDAAKEVTYAQCMFVDNIDNLAARRARKQRYQIEKGIHFSFTKQRLATLVGMNDKIVKCVLPKGTQYVKGVTEFGVANQIIIPKFKIK